MWWSWILTAVGITGLYLAGRKRKMGWAIGISAQVLWLTYAIVTEQWGFVVSAFAYGWVYITNWKRWRADEQKEFYRGLSKVSLRNDRSS